MSAQQTCPSCGQRIRLRSIVEQVIANGYEAVGDIKSLTRGYVEATDKEIYNALAGLARRNRIRRVGHGRYAPALARKP